MHKLGLILVVLILLGGSIAIAQSTAVKPFDGKWLTKLTCPAKGNTEGYTWQFASVVENGSFKGERGTAGEPGYLLLEGKIKDDGSAKLSANGIVASRQYARGVFARKGEEYSYNVKAQFKENEGTGAETKVSALWGVLARLSLRSRLRTPRAASRRNGRNSPLCRAQETRTKSPIPHREHPKDQLACSRELAAPAIILQRRGTIVIMRSCKLSSRRREAWTVCAASPTPGIVG